MTLRYFIYLIFCFTAGIVLYFLINKQEDVRPINHALENNKLGVWLWYLDRTGFKSHKVLGDTLSKMGVKRIFIKVADGRNFENWPELHKKSIVRDYAKRHIEAWAWSYNYTDNDSLQAEALYLAAKTGYKGFVVDIEKEFDGQPEKAKKLFEAFAKARQRAIKKGYINANFKLFCTTWGNVKDHRTPIASIDPYVDGYMPQTYVELWGESFVENIKYWINIGNLEYRTLGASKPLYHIISTETGIINAYQINQFIKIAGPETSLWRIPGGGVPDSVWLQWKQVDWDHNFSETQTKDVIHKDSCNTFMTINYCGTLQKIEMHDTGGTVMKLFGINHDHTYAIDDLCPGSYTLNIYHEKRIAIIPIDL